MYLKIVKCVYKNVPYLYKKYRMCMKKSWHQKNMFEKNVNHVFEKMFNEYTKMFHVLEWKVKRV